MIDFRYNKETGILEAWKDGKMVGDICTIGDLIASEPPSEVPTKWAEREEK